jgi:hypothetical protein
MRTAQKPKIAKPTPVECTLASYLTGCPERFQKRRTAFDDLVRDLHGKWSFIIGHVGRKRFPKNAGRTVR